jgi:hypothetical protein
MGSIHKKIRKYSPAALAEQAVLGKETYETLHPMGTAAEAAYDAAKEAEKALEEAEKDPSKEVIPMPDEEEIARQRRRKNASRRGSRALTDLTPDEGFGG